MMLKMLKAVLSNFRGTKKRRDFFEPTTSPARCIYKAFRDESMKREGRLEREWREAEITAVHKEALVQAEKHGLNAISRDQVILAESRAVGSADYGAKWAYKVVDAMRADHFYSPQGTNSYGEAKAEYSSPQAPHSTD